MPLHSSDPDEAERETLDGTFMYVLILGYMNRALREPEMESLHIPRIYSEKQTNMMPSVCRMFNLPLDVKTPPSAEKPGSSASATLSYGSFDLFPHLFLETKPT